VRCTLFIDHALMCQTKGYEEGPTRRNEGFWHTRGGPGLRRSVPRARHTTWELFRAQGRTAVIYTDVDRGGINQLAWFVVFRSRKERSRLFKGNTYQA
jgi:hypothetical protein